MRRLLVAAATRRMTQVKRFSPPKSWAIRLSARKDFKKAAVATAQACRDPPRHLARWNRVQSDRGTSNLAVSIPARGKRRFGVLRDGGRSISPETVEGAPPAPTS
jgi:hypothetical protein